LIFPKKASGKTRIEYNDAFPDDILREIKKDPAAWENYNNFFDPYKRIRVAFKAGARNRSDEFKKRPAYFIKKTHENKMIGYGGIDKYFKKEKK